MPCGEFKVTDISVITATLNSREWLQRCIDSVLAQQNVSVQHVLIDGGSTDGTIDVLRSQTDPRVHVLLGRDSGVYEAWNKGVRAATGEWILFLGSDDFVLGPTVFEFAMTCVSDKTSQPVFAYGNVLKGNVDGSGIPERYGYWDPAAPCWSWPTRSYPPHPSTFHSRKLFEMGAAYDESYRYSADAKFFFQKSQSAEILHLDLDVVWFSRGGLTNRKGNHLARWLESNRLRQELAMKRPAHVLVKSLLSAIKHDTLHWISQKLS